MALQDLMNEPLGEKHKKYNKQVIDAIADKKTVSEAVFIPRENDLDNLLKIDIASNQKQVDFILSVLKYKDMLYVSRALNQSKWLVDDQYEHIFNPGNLRNQLFPHMTTEAGIKLTKFLRKNLKNETRVEVFLQSEKEPKYAAKWLSRCSIPFIENNIHTYKAHLDNMEIKRLCEKSVSIFDAATKNKDYDCRMILKAASFLINNHLEKYLGVVESVSKHERPSLNAKATDTIMKQASDRIKDKFEIYSAVIDIPTFVKYFRSDEIKGFLYKQANEDFTNCHRPPRFYKFAVIKQFVLRMPKEEQFDFVKNFFIDKALLLIAEDTLEKGSEMFASRVLCNAVCTLSPSFMWYEFATFDIAFTEIKKLIETAPNRDKSEMFKLLLTCADGNMNHIQAVLSYYNAQHIKEEIHQKNEFFDHVVSRTDIHKFDDTTWLLLDKILVSMDVYVDTAKAQQNCLEILILYSLLNNKPIPKIIEDNYPFNTFNKYQKKLGHENGIKVFDHLFNRAKKAIEDIEINSEESFSAAIKWLDYLLTLLKDWNKSLTEYPFIPEQIKDFIKIKKDNKWKSDLTTLYNKNKSWRKVMFEESLILHPTEEVYINAIKHDPTLLVRHKDEVEMICSNDTVFLGKLLNKLRIYWPNSLAEDWSKSYVARLNKLDNQKSLVRGVCTILPQNELNVIIKKYAPVEAKIDWGKTDELTLSLQRILAKSMHIARPQPAPEYILMYAKGDYLQYALPSLLAIYYNLSRVDSKKQVPKLLDKPVSLQKHGLRLAFIKLDNHELKEHLTNIWKTSKNRSIRTVIFQLMYELLRKEKNPAKAKELCDLMGVFVDNLSYQEDDKIYELLPRIRDVPLCVRPEFLIKSYKFLEALIRNTKKDSHSYQYNLIRLAEYTRDIMKYMPKEFIVDILNEFIQQKYFKFDRDLTNVRSRNSMVTVLSAYLLSAKDEMIQMKRYEEVLAPLISRSFDKWNEQCEGSYYIRRNMQEILKCLLGDLKDYIFRNNLFIPTKLFAKIQIELQKLPIPENYLLITMWTLTQELAELLKSTREDDTWEEVCEVIAKDFGKYCLEYLKHDVTTYFPCIYMLYAKALEMVLEDFSMEVRMDIFEQMLADSGCVQAYLATTTMCPKYFPKEELEKLFVLKKTIQDHPSVEVRMHYYNYFRFEV